MPSSEPQVVHAVLLVGPTGSGKSPVGMLLERGGGFRHFDFGAELRAAAEGRRGLEAPDVAFVRRLLATHALLPDERFDVAARLLDAFLARARLDPAHEVLVLNGLPRHVGQARAMASRVRIAWVVVLECEAGVAAARVARRRGGESLDHARREDDSADAVARKLALYARETAPLVAFYEAEPSVRVVRLRVEADHDEVALAEEIRRAIS